MAYTYVDQVAVKTLVGNTSYPHYQELFLALADSITLTSITPSVARTKGFQESFSVSDSFAGVAHHVLNFGDSLSFNFFAPVITYNKGTELYSNVASAPVQFAVRPVDANGDYTFGLPFLTDSAEAVQQVLQSRLCLALGEWFADQDAGVPWSTEILGKYTSASLDGAIQSAILASPYVESITAYKSSYNGTTRALSVTATVVSYFGIVKLNTTINSGGVLPNAPFGVINPPTTLPDFAYRAMDSTGDYQLGQPFLKNSPAAVGQAVLTRMRLHRGEWFADTSAGVPYETEMLIYDANPAVYNAMVQNAILETPGVTSIESYTATVGGVETIPASSPNLIKDSNLELGTAYWSLGDLTITPNAGAITGNAFTFTSTAAGPVGYNFPYSALINVIPGQTYTLSGYIDNTQVTSGYTGWIVYTAPLNFGGPGIAYANLGAGQSGRTSVTFTVPAGVTQISIICDTLNCSVAAAGNTISFSNPQLEANPYATSYNGIGSATSSVSTRGVSISVTINTIYGQVSISAIPKSTGMLYSLNFEDQVIIIGFTN